jgi:hypothetical protein
MLKVLKRFTSTFLLVSFFIACHSVGEVKDVEKTSLNINNSDSSKHAVITFDESEHNFGRIYEGEQVGWYFKFKNTGTKDLLITDAYASCGCTVPYFFDEPVHPGGEGEIKVIFDSQGRSGIQNKTVTVESNATNKKINLIITAEIVNQ